MALEGENEQVNEQDPTIEEPQVPAGDDLFDGEDDDIPSPPKSEPGEADTTEADDDSRSEEEKPEGDGSPESEGGSVLDPSVVQVATNAGMTQEDIRNCGSTAELENRLIWASRRGWLGGKNEQPKAEPVPQPEEVRAEPKSDGKAPSKFELPSELDEYDEQIANIIRKMNDHYAEQIDQVRNDAQVARRAWSQQSEAQQREQMIKDVDWFDAKIAELGDDYVDILGTGKSLQLDTKSQHFIDRAAIYEDLLHRVTMYRRAGQMPPPLDSLFERSLFSVIGKTINQHSKESARKELVKAVADRSRAVMGRPASRNGSDKPKTGAKAAQDFYDDFMKKRGVTVAEADGVDEELDGFL